MARFLPRWPIAVLLAVLVGLDVIAIFFLPRAMRSPDREMVIIGLAFGETVLVGAWAALGTLRVVFRLPMAVLATGVLIRFILVAFEADHPAIGRVMLAVGGLTASVAGALGLARAVGVRLTLVSATGAFGERNVHRFQFSLSQLLQIVACWSLALTILRWLFPPLNSISQDDADWVKKELPVFIAFFGAPVLIGVWVFLSGKKPLVRISIFTVLLPALAYPFRSLLGEPSDEVIHIYFVCSAVLIAALLTARLSGYRVSRAIRVTPAPPTGN
jgi:hypothetical protein